MIYWACKRCAEGLEAPECLAGDRLRCPKCKRLCRVPAVAQERADSETLVSVGASETASTNGTHAEARPEAPPAPVPSGHDKVESFDVEHHEPSADFAVSRISAEDFDEVASHEVLDAAATDSTPLIEIAADLAPATGNPNIETEIREQGTPNGAAQDSSMSELIADAVDDELHEHVATNGSHPTATVEPASESAIASQITTEELDQAQELERELEAIAPLMQRQLGPAIAQYSSREQAKTAMFARAVVDVYPTRLNVQSHEHDRIVLNVRYRRILRRTMIGTKNLPDMTVEATFVNNAGSWSLDRWQKTVTV